MFEAVPVEARLPESTPEGVHNVAAHPRAQAAAIEAAEVLAATARSSSIRSSSARAPAARVSTSAPTSTPRAAATHAPRADAASWAQQPAAELHALSSWLPVMLDQVDHPMILLDADSQAVLYANRAAKADLAPHPTDESRHPLACQFGRIIACDRDDAVALAEAICAARGRGIRRLLELGREGDRVSVAVLALTLPQADGKPHGAILLMLGKRRVCGDLSAFWYARSHGLTQAECTVLQSLCKGHGPSDIAREHSVAITTVRTQLAAIRSKTGAASLRNLVNEVACLPPLMHALGVPITH